MRDYYRKSLIPCGRLGLVLWFCFAGAVAIAFEKPKHKLLPDLDNGKAGVATPTPRQRDALQRLQTSNRKAKVDLHPLRGSPQWVRPGEGNALSRGVAGNAFDPAVSIRSFVAQYQDLFGHPAGVLDGVTMRRQATNSHNQVRTLAWEQSLDEIPVYGSIFLGHVNRNGDLLALSSTFVPEVERAAENGAVESGGRFSLEGAVIDGKGGIRVGQAIVIAAESIEQPIDPASVTSNALPFGPARKQEFSVQDVPGLVECKLRWWPRDQTTLRLCWQVDLTRRIGGERYRVLVDVQSGEVQVRRCLTVNAAPATFRVFTGDSPSPMSPGSPVPGTNQPALVPRELVTLTSLFTNASPIGWINEAENQTRGNNVDAHLDRNADDLPDLPRPQGSPFRVFDFNLDLTQAPSTYGDASVVQLFFWCNWMHDQLYQLGFDEAAGNFQKDNFGRGGVEGDPVLADAQDGSGFNNANFTPTDDGISPRVQMYIFNSPAPARDGDLDAEIILHEYTHGLSTRLVGGGVGIDALQSQGMGEGWSDFYALSVMSQPQDDPDAVYAMGGYVTYQLGGLTENYYYGIRRYPYCTDLTKNPLTFKDIDPTKAVGHPGIPTNPINPFNRLFVDEVHAQGEVWCSTLWQARSRMIHKYGFAAGNQLMLQLVTDGMKLSPANPTFVQARDAILLADEVNNGGENLEELWEAFASRGLGFNAVAPASSTTVGVFEAFDLPDQLGIVPSSRFSPGGPVAGPFTPSCTTYVLTNHSTNALTWSLKNSQTWLEFSAKQGVLPGHGGTNITVCLATNALSLPAGIFRDTLVFSNVITGARQTRSVDFRIFQVAGVPFFDGFETGSLDPHWLSTGTGDFRTAVTATDGPHSGSFHCTFDNFGSGNFARNELTLGVDLFGYTNVVLQFWAKSFGDEPDGPPPVPFVQGADFDGVAISQDGNFWYEVQELRTVPATNRQYTVSLDQALSRFGLNYNSLFRIRFNHYDNFGIPFDGLAIDDVSVTGLPVFRLALSCPAHLVETNGILAAGGEVTLAAAAAFDVVVQLQSDHPDRLQVPPSVVVPAGALSAAFNLTAINDFLLNGSTPVSVTASAPGFAPSSVVTVVDDDETATLRLQIPSKAREGAGILAGAGTVRVSRRVQADIPVALTSSDPGAVVVPPFVIVPKGKSTADFDLQLPDDQQLTGNRLVQVTAHVENWPDDTASIQLDDNEVAELTLQLPARVSEGNGTLPKVAAIQLSGTVATNVQVSLSSGSPTLLQVPATIEVVAGRNSASFDLTVLDDSIVNGLRNVTISASASGFASTSGKLDVIDDETAPAPYDPSPSDNASNAPLTTVLSWRSAFGELLVNGGFETGDFTGWQLDNTDFGSFIINDGKVDPEGPEPPTPPWKGNFSVVTSQIGSGRHVLSQVVFVPDEARTVRLSWTDRIRNYGTDYVPFTQEFRVEVRDLNDTLLTTVFATKPGDPLTNDWVRRTFDISQFRGQTIRLAFIEQDLTSYFNLHLDDISLFLDAAAAPSFDVYFGTNAAFKASDFRGTITNTFWPPPQLDLTTTYFWKIVERLGTTATPGPVWRFTTRGVGPVHHYDWGALPSAVEVNRPFAATVIARDDIGNRATNASTLVQISALPPPLTASTIVISEFDTGSNDALEFQNVSGRAIDISGWKMTLWDGRTWPAPRVTVTIPSNTICPQAAIFQLQRLGTAPGTFPTFFMGTNIFWNNNPVGNQLAILLRDADNNIVDFACAYSADPAQITNPVAIPHDQWIGDSIPASPDALLTFQRIGQSDRNSGGDWAYQTNSIGVRNEHLTLPFQPANPIGLIPSSALLSSGIWTGQVTLQKVEADLTLLARDNAGRFGFSSPIDVASPGDLALSIFHDVDLTIPGNAIHYAVTVRNNGSNAFSGLVLTNRPPSNVQIVSATSSQGQCGVLDGMLFCNLGLLGASNGVKVLVDVTNIAPGFVTNVFGVHANEFESYLANNVAAVISTVRLPEIAINDVTVNEGNVGTLNATFNVRLSAASTLPVSVNFATADRTAIAGVDYLPASGMILFPPGSTNQTLVVKILGDVLDEISETFEVDLFSPVNGTIIDPVGVGRITDDDAGPTIRISDVTVTEPVPGATTSAIFNVTLSAPSGIPVTFTFATSNGTAIAEKDYLPQEAPLTIAPGQTNVLISIPVLGDRASEGPETFFVNLFNILGASVGDVQGRATILDNGFAELDHFTVTAAPSPQYQGFPFVTTIAAQDGRSNAFTPFAGTVAITAVAPRPQISVGSGTSIWSVPFGAAFEDVRTQIIYPAASLGGPANISGLSLFVTTPPGQTLSNWTIRLKHTGLATYSRASWERTNWTLVYRKDETIFSLGWLTFRFETPFVYDGTNNLLLDLSFNNSTYSANGAIQVQDTGLLRSIWAHTDSAFGDPLQWEGTNSPPPIASTLVPNIRLLREDPLSSTPARSGDFLGGVWSGLVTVNSPSTNVVLRVSDGLAHFGLSDPFVVEPNTDADHDGLPDAWQNRYFGESRINAGPNDDPDHDGVTNLQELLGGTNPLDALDAIRITSVRVVGSDVHLQFQTVKGRGYIVERAADPGNGSWATLSQVAAGASGSATVIDAGRAAQAVQFYRIRLLR